MILDTNRDFLVMSLNVPINIDGKTISAFCRKCGISKLALFGSVLREDFGADSDIDVLVEFQPAHIPDFFALLDMEEELSGIVGRAVEMRTPNDLSRYFREDVLRDAVIQYVE